MAIKTAQCRSLIPTSRLTRLVSLALCASVFVGFAAPASAQILRDESQLPEPMRDIEPIDRLGQMVPLDIKLTNAAGEQVTLGDYLNQGKPVVLAMVYYNCPLICPLTLQRLQGALNGMSYVVGKDFNTLVVSFDHTDTTEIAASIKDGYLGGYNKTMTDTVRSGWEFHTASKEEARRLGNAIGFRYKYDPKSGEYGHSTLVHVLTPEGRVARYLSGLDYTGQDLRLALLDATDGKIAQSIGDIFFHTCFKWDPNSGSYSLWAFQVMRIGALLTMFLLAGLIVILRMHEKRRARRAANRVDSCDVATFKPDTAVETMP